MGPIGAVRVGRIGGEFVVNPTYAQIKESDLDLVVSGTRAAIMMVEAGAKHPDRGRDGRGDHVRPPRAPAGHRPAGAAPRAGRQDEAHPVPSSPAPTRCSTSLDAVEGRQALGRVRRRDHQPRRQARRDRRDRRGQGPGRQGHRPLVHARQARPAHRRRAAPRHHREGRREGAFGGRRRRSSSSWPATRSLVGHNVGFDMGFLEARWPTHAHRARAAISTP